MSEQKPPRAGGIPIWGIFLVFLGVLFLLQTLGILPWGLWGTLWRFWPVLIIIIGVGILLRRYNPWLVSLLILAILGASLGIAIWQYGPTPPGGVATKSYSQPLEHLERAQIEIDFTKGNLTIVSLPANSPNLVEASSETRSKTSGMVAEFHHQNGDGRLHLSTEKLKEEPWDKAGLKWWVNLTRSIPLVINIESAASDLALDLSELSVTEIRLDLAAANCKLKLPSSAGITQADIKADVANLEIVIPAGVAAKIKADIALSIFEVDTSRFPKKSDYYISDNFDTAQNRLYLEIDSDVGRVEVR